MDRLAEVTAVDLFCGAAGLSYGLMQSGIRIGGGIDLDPSCRHAFEKNTGSIFIEHDVAKVDPSLIQDLFGGTKYRVLAACAPCQPFSGYTTRLKGTDQRWQLLVDFLKLANIIRPEIITVENVPRLTHLPLWASFVQTLRSLGYSVDWKIVDAAKYGVPQNRNRLVLLASKLGKISVPDGASSSVKTVRWAIGDLPEVPAGQAIGCDPLHRARALTPINLARIRASRQAGTWRDWPAELRVDCHRIGSGRTYPSVYGRMSWDKPAPTITTQFYGYGNGRFGHPEQDRAITLREGAILQSFPEDFQFFASIDKINFREIGRLIGNAVPPILAQSIGNQIIHHVTSWARP